MSNLTISQALRRIKMLKLQTAIAQANAKTIIDWDSKNIPLALAVRTLRELAAEIDWVKKLPVKAQDKTVETEREHDGEKWVNIAKQFTCHLPEAKRADMAAELQDRFDKLNDIVETTNHKTAI